MIPILFLRRAHIPRRLTVALIVLLLIVRASGLDSAAAQPAVASNECVRQAETRMAQQQRIFREIIVGRLSAQKRPVNSAGFTEDGTPWIKTAPNTWKTAAVLSQLKTITDSTMNQKMEWELMNEVPNHTGPRSRDGILAGTGVTTSQIVHQLSHSYRALSCRLAMVCAGVSTARTDGAGFGNVSIITPGCTELFMKPMEHCVDGEDATTSITACHRAAEAILDREAALLRFAVSYDASYRSLLQFSGNFDGFLDNFRTDILQPLEQTLSILGQLHRIPCFTSQCNG